MPSYFLPFRKILKIEWIKLLCPWFCHFQSLVHCNQFSTTTHFSCSIPMVFHQIRFFTPYVSKSCPWHMAFKSVLNTVLNTEYTLSARLSFQPSELGPPTPSPARGCCSFLFASKWGGDTLAGGGGVHGGGPIPTKGKTFWYSNIIPLRL